MDQLQERERTLELREAAVLKHEAAVELAFHRMVRLGKNLSDEVRNSQVRVDQLRQQIQEEKERFSRQQRRQPTSTSEVSANHVARRTRNTDPGPPYSADNLPPWYR